MKSTKLLREITDEEIQRYHEDGAVVLRQIMPHDWIDFMRDAVDEVLASPKGFGMDMQADGAPGRFFGDLYTYRWNDNFKELVFDSPLPEMIQKLFNSRRVNFFGDQLLVKEPNTPNKTPWHHDISYWPLKGEQIASVWMPLDKAVRESGTIAYIKGSHHYKNDYQAVTFSEKDVWNNAEDALPVPDFDAEPEKYEVLCWDVEPGDLLLHHANTFHSALGNMTKDMRRRAIALRYTGDDVTYAPTEYSFTEQPMFKSNVPEDNLQPGDPMGGALYPQVYPRL
ncbi:MAG: hypothetical protein CMF31_09895 [Kordiimonas sp.]|nr:hypothetical protein [Kordiimonas sp.]|tara:strand:+ start:841 stop:1686 length:846 start_codon:yes stop_codon:yes gene_type:complete